MSDNGVRTDLGWPLGRVAGVPVYLGKSWLVIGAIMVVTFGPQLQWIHPGLGALAYVIAGVFALALLLSVFVHELSHALTARAQGLMPQHIALTLWGGHTQFLAADLRPVASFLVAFAGPLANLVLAAIGWLLLGQLDGGSAVLVSLLNGFVYTNVFVGVFNLLPGLPLDGGAMLEAIIWKVTGRRSTGTRVAAYLGMAMAAGVLVYAFQPFLRGGQLSMITVIWSVMIAGMLWSSARSALGVAQYRARADRLRVPDLLAPAMAVPGSTTVIQLASQLSGQPVAVVAVLGQDGWVGGLVDPQAFQSALGSGQPVPVAGVSSVFPGDRMVEESDGVDAVAARFADGSTQPVLVARHGTVVGAVTAERLLAALNATG